VTVQVSLDADHAERRDRAEIATAFKAHLSPAFEYLTRKAAGLDPGREPGPSLATCEKVPTSAELEVVTDATEALRIAIGRSRERQAKVLELIKVDEVAHAKRLAACGRRSVQLECGDCGSRDNFVPISCGSRLCEDCMNQKMGRVAGQYLPVVESWRHPRMLRLSLPHRVDPDDVEQAVDALRGAFGRLRRRKVPHSGDGWDWEPWRSILRARDEFRLAARWDQERKQGRGIPMDEIMRAGFYGIDLKQGDDGTINVHMHVLADIPYLPQAALSELWDDLIDAPVVDIRQIEDQNGNGRESALMEVIGYAAKPPEYENVEDEIAYFEALKGSKLIQPFGELHGNTPDGGLPMYCCQCERSPDRWRYAGTVDGRYETVGVGAAPDGDRPPPS
jgi:hypothetical protein